MNDGNKACDTMEDKETLKTVSSIAGISQSLLRKIHNK